MDGSDDDFYNTIGYTYQSGFNMNNATAHNKCADDTQQITIHLPCRLAERIDRYASENGSTLTSVVIEALDQFLRGRKVV